MMTCEEREPEKTQKRSQTETKERRKERKWTKFKTTRRRKWEQKGVKRDQNGSKWRPQHIKRDQRMGEVRKVVKRMLPDTSEIESYSRKTKVFTFDGLDAGTTPGQGVRPTRQIRGGPSWRPARRVLIAPGHSCNGPRLNFIDFLTVQSGIEKSVIFRIASKRPKWRYQSTFGRPRYVFLSNNTTFGLPFRIVFSIIFENGESVKQDARAPGLSWHTE